MLEARPEVLSPVDHFLRDSALGEDANNPAELRAIPQVEEQLSLRAHVLH